MFIARLIIYDKRNLTVITETLDILKTIHFFYVLKNENENKGHNSEALYRALRSR